MRLGFIPLVGVLTATLVLTGMGAKAQRQSRVPLGEWRSYASDSKSTKYSPLTRINASNFKRLKLAWTWSTPDNTIRQKEPDAPNSPYEATPLLVHGTLYTSTSFGIVAALNPTTGKPIWTYDPGFRGGVNRGVAYWEKGSDRRIFHCTFDNYLVALDAKTGKPIATFGSNGRVDMTKSVRRLVERNQMTQSSPPAVCGDVIVVSGAIDDFRDTKEMPPGDVRGFDAKTGKLLWTFHSVPAQGEAGNETWLNDSWKYTGGTNVWTWMSYDPELDYVYLPFGTPNNDWYGGHRLGDGLYGESLVCLNAKTGKKVWHYQMVHHGLWDYDLPCAPILVDVVVNGKKVKAVAQVTKQAFCFVFDRVTGKPLWDIQEKKVPPTPMPGDVASPTQPFPTKPKPFDLQDATEDNLINFTPELRKQGKEILKTFRHGVLYTPPTLERTIEMPGWVGGASWAGAAVDPETGILYVPSINNPMWAQLIKPESPNATVKYRIGPSGATIDGPQGLPLFKPPYGRITAIDLNSGEHRWMVPHGDGPKNHPAIKHLKLPDLGIPNRGFTLVTKTLLITAQEGSWFNTSPPKYPAKLRAYDKKTGKLLGEVNLPAHATGAPMTYMANGKQYIAIPVGGNIKPAELIAMVLDE